MVSITKYSSKYNTYSYYRIDNRQQYNDQAEKPVRFIHKASKKTFKKTFLITN